MLHGHSYSPPAVGGISPRRRVRVLLLFLMACPLIAYLMHSMITVYAGVQRAHCEQELQAVHMLYKDRVARVLADLQRQLAKETALLKTLTIKEREAHNAESSLLSAESSVRDLTQRVQELEQDLSAAEEAAKSRAIAPPRLDPAGRAEGQPEQPSSPPVTPFASASIPDAPVLRSGNVEVRPLDHLHARNAESKAQAAAAAALTTFDTPVPEDIADQIARSEATPPTVTPSDSASKAQSSSSDKADKELQALQAIAQVLRPDAASGAAPPLAARLEASITHDSTEPAATPQTVDPEIRQAEEVIKRMEEPAREEALLQPPEPVAAPKSGALPLKIRRRRNTGRKTNSTRRPSHQILRDSAPLGTPVIVLSRMVSPPLMLRLTLHSLLASQPPTGHPIFVSLEGSSGDTVSAGTTELLHELKGKVHVLLYRSGDSSTSITASMAALQAASDHIRFVCEEAFGYLAYDRIILLSAGHLVAPDFFSFFARMESVLDADTSLMGVSGFNPHGVRAFVGGAENAEASGAARNVLRTDVLPLSSRLFWPLDPFAAPGGSSFLGLDLPRPPAGLASLGWMLRKELWMEELRERWPAGDAVGPASGGGSKGSLRWDAWLRTSPVLKRPRDFVYPEVSRIVPASPVELLTAMKEERESGSPAEASAVAALTRLKTQIVHERLYELHASKLSWESLGIPSAAAVAAAASSAASAASASSSPALFVASVVTFDYLLASNYPAFLGSILDSPSTLKLDHLPSDRELSALRMEHRNASVSTPTSTTGAGNEAAEVAGKDQEAVVRYRSPQQLADMLRQSARSLTALSSAPCACSSHLRSCGCVGSETLGLSSAFAPGSGPPRCSFRGVLSFRRFGHRVWIAPDLQATPDLIEQLAQPAKPTVATQHDSVESTAKQQ